MWEAGSPGDGQNHHSSYLMGWSIRFVFRKRVQQHFNEMLFFLSCRYDGHLVLLLRLVQKEFLEQIMALLHNNQSVRSLEPLFLQKLYKEGPKQRNTHIQRQKIMPWWLFRWYKTSKWNRVKTVKQLTVFQSFKEQFTWGNNFQGNIASRRDCKAVMLLANSSMCIMHTLPYSSINLATSQAAAQLLRTARTEINWSKKSSSSSASTYLWFVGLLC